MSDARDDELYADRPYRPGPPPELREPPPRRSRALGVFVATFALAAFAGVVWYAYDQGLQRGSEATAPLIKADPTPAKVRPQQPGGLQVPNQDKLVYEAMRPGDATAPRVERLLPPPEKPVDPPAPPPPPPLPQVSEAAPSAEATVPPADSAPADSAPADNSPSTAAPSSDGSIPPARIVTPAPAPLIPTPDDSQPAPTAEARPEPAAPPPPPATETPAPTAPVTAAEKPTAQQPRAEQPAAEKPAPPPAPAPAPARPAAGGFRIQVGALRDQAAAEAEWRRLQKRFRDELGGLEHRIQRIDLGPGKGVFFRIQSGGVSEGAAGAICTSLKAKGQPCIVVKP